MGHGHAQYTLPLHLKELPYLTVALEFVVVRAAKALGGSRVDGNQGAADRVDSDHRFEKGRDPAEHAGEGQFFLRDSSRSQTVCVPSCRRSNAELFHHLPAHEVFIHNPGQNLRGAGVIPDVLGINHRNRTPFANPQAIGLGPKEPGIMALQFPETRLEKLPGLKAEIAATALGLALVTAEEYVALFLMQTQLLCNFC
jgi:hypothetical protein